MSYIIYKICCDDLPEFIYVGSTKSFRNRKSSHKKDYNKGDTKKLYTTIRENGGWDKWRMVIVEDIGEVSLTQARIKEEEHRVKLNANLNSRNCYSDRKYYNKEWRENNKDLVKEKYNEYYNNNKEKVNKQHNDWGKVKITCECGKEIARGHLSHHTNTLFHKKYISNIIVDEDNESA